FGLDDAERNRTLVEIAGNPDPTANLIAERIGWIGNGVALTTLGDEHQLLAIEGEVAVNGRDPVDHANREARHGHGSVAAWPGDPDVSAGGASGQCGVRPKQGDRRPTRRRAYHDLLVPVGADHGDYAAHRVGGDGLAGGR